MTISGYVDYQNSCDLSSNYASGAIACRIRKEILTYNRSRLQKYNGRVDAKEMWAAVRQLTGRHLQPVTVDSIDANSLNEHYAKISTDTAYTLPPPKLTANQEWTGSQITGCLRFAQIHIHWSGRLACLVLTARCSCVLQDSS